MPNFNLRSTQKELLDKDDIPFEDIRRNMVELNTINTLLGGHAITVAGVKALIETRESKPLVICEIGCGGGDNLAAIADGLKLEKGDLELIGLDIKKECLQAAAEAYPEIGARWIERDYRKMSFYQLPDIVFSSLFCHHFTQQQLVEQMQWMYQNSNEGFFINDLHRHPLAYYSIKLITWLFSRSYLVRNDAPVSVLRGFTKKEWTAILRQAGISNYSITWKWAFRYLIIVRK